MTWSRAFQKCIIYHFLDSLFCKHFYSITRFCKKNKFLQICIFFLQILKVVHKSFPMMYQLSYLDIKHGIQRGGGKLTPPQLKFISFSSGTPPRTLVPASQNYPQRCKDERIRICKDARIQRYKDSKMQGYKDEKMQGYKDAKMQRCKDTKMKRYKDTKM